jgi:hypothetical protein
VYSDKREVGYVAAELGPELTQDKGKRQVIPTIQGIFFPKNIYAQIYYPIFQIRQLNHKATRPLGVVEINEATK